MNATPPPERLRVLLPHRPEESVADAARLLRALFDPSCVHLRRIFVQRPLGQEVFLSSEATAAEITRIERDASNATRVQSEHDMLTLAGEGFEVSADVLGGSPRAEVLRDATLWPADLIVVRAQQAGHDEDRLGQMASALLHHAPCPVLLHHDVPASYAVRRLLVRVDFSAASRRAARWGSPLLR
jgi:nucleotide-binding universal stress UspA family protein